LPVLVDADPIFARDTNLQRPEGFVNGSLAALLRAPQIAAGKTPCAFLAAATALQPGQSVTVTALFGHASSKAALAGHAQRLRDPVLIAHKRDEARALAVEITDPIATRSGEPLFDGYSRQSFLDNVLRGGKPEWLGDPAHPHVYYIYLRKHGDLERDYNDFFLSAEYYSQGNGNFRDVAQNRRNDIWFWPELGDFNIRLHLSLIQADGYNRAAGPAGPPVGRAFHPRRLAESAGGPRPAPGPAAGGVLQPGAERCRAADPGHIRRGLLD